MKSKVSKIVSKVLMAAVGVMLIANPGTALESLIRFLGAALLLIGLFGIITYILSPLKGFISTVLFVFAVIASLLSLIPIIDPSVIIAIFPIIIGIALAINGITNTVEAFALKGVVGLWIVPLILSLLTVAAGCAIAFYPFKTMNLLVRVVGIIMVYSSVVGLYMAISYKPKVMSNGVIDITNSN